MAAFGKGTPLKVSVDTPVGRGSFFVNDLVKHILGIVDKEIGNIEFPEQDLDKYTTGEVDSFLSGKVDASTLSGYVKSSVISNVIETIQRRIDEVELVDGSQDESIDGVKEAFAGLALTIAELKAENNTAHMKIEEKIPSLDGVAMLSELDTKVLKIKQQILHDVEKKIKDLDVGGGGSSMAIRKNTNTDNTASNLGGGEGVFAQKNGIDLEFKSLVAGSGVGLTATSTEITITSTVTGGATVDTRSNILATASPTDGDLAYATDYSRSYVNYNSTWFVDPIPLLEDDQAAPNIGIQQDFVTNYNTTYITDFDLANCNLDSCIVRDSYREENRMLRSVSMGGNQYQLQYYVDGAWRPVLTGIELNEAANDMLLFTPFGTDNQIQAHTGNSQALGLNGRPKIQAYEVDIGSYPVRRVYDSKYFDGTNFGDW